MALIKASMSYFSGYSYLPVLILGHDTDMWPKATQVITEGGGILKVALHNTDTYMPAACSAHILMGNPCLVGESRLLSVQKSRRARFLSLVLSCSLFPSFLPSFFFLSLVLSLSFIVSFFLFPYLFLSFSLFLSLFLS